MARNKLRKEKELNQIKKSTNVFFNIIFIILSALCIFPIVFVFSISISSETSIQKNGYQLIPQELSAAAYQFLWNERGTILHATFISILVTALGIILSVLLTTTMGYVVSRNTYKLKSFYTWVIFIPMIFNGGMLAGYVVNTNILHLRNSIWALILPLAVSPFNIVICKTFLKRRFLIPSWNRQKLMAQDSFEFLHRSFYRFQSRSLQQSHCSRHLDIGMTGFRHPYIFQTRIYRHYSLC